MKETTVPNLVVLLHMFKIAILRFHEEKKEYKKRFINLLPVIHLGFGAVIPVL